MHLPTKLSGEPDHTVKPYAAVVEEMCYEAQRLIPMPEKTAMLYYCFKQKFYEKFGGYLTDSNAFMQNHNPLNRTEETYMSYSSEHIQIMDMRFSAHVTVAEFEQWLSQVERFS